MTLRELFTEETGWKIDDASPEIQPYHEYAVWLEARYTRLRTAAFDGVVSSAAIEDTGLYPQAITGGPNAYEKRTERMEGHNECIMGVTTKAVAMEEWINKHPLREDILDAVIFGNVDLISRDDGKRVGMYVNCNDVFYWACADAEDITPEELPDLRKCLIESPQWGHMLWCCRKRGMRPQNPWFKEFDEPTKKLFEACGPARSDKECG